MKRINEKIAEGESVYGFCGHPRDAHGDLENVSHLIERLSVTKGVGWGVASILVESGPGKTVKTILKCNGKIGCSLRGTGDVVNGIVSENYTMLGVDWVISPSFGRDTKFDKSGIIEKKNFADSSATKKLFAEAQDAGYEGTFEDFKKIRNEADNLAESETLAKEFLDDEAKIAGK